MKTGILGGSFNPPHNGHLYLAAKAKELLKLDRIFVIPAGQPPHKDLASGATDNDRFQMVSLAFEGLLEYNILDIEMREKKPSYTIETIEKLKKLYPDDIFYLLMGIDMFVSFEKWFRFEDIFKNAIIVAAPRNNAEKEKMIALREHYSSEYSALVEVLEIEPNTDSSTKIRAKIKENEDISGSVQKKVQEYISKNQLYR